jgi:hypothetical protein
VVQKGYVTLISRNFNLSCFYLPAANHSIVFCVYETISKCKSRFATKKDIDTHTHTRTHTDTDTHRHTHDTSCSASCVACMKPSWTYLWKQTINSYVLSVSTVELKNSQLYEDEDHQKKSKHSKIVMLVVNKINFSKNRFETIQDHTAEKMYTWAGGSCKVSVHNKFQERCTLQYTLTSKSYYTQIKQMLSDICD